jgi:hypothetical protein
MDVFVKAVGAVRWLHQQVENSNDEKLEAIKDAEGCPHIELIRGFTTPYNGLIARLGARGGIAWQAADNNQWWYWHPQAVRGRGLHSVNPPIGGKNCNLCLAAIRARQSQ